MTINLYKISFDTRELDKVNGVTPVNPTAITVDPLNAVSTIHPVFVLDYNSNYVNCNYLYCDTLDSYYYITDRRINTAGRLELLCTIDVRTTFSAAIKSTPCTIIRADSIGNPTKIIDSKLPVNPQKKYITSIVLPETSNTMSTTAEYSYLLTVIGGTPNI